MPLSAMNGDGLSQRLQTDRNRVQVQIPQKGESTLVDCSAVSAERCPQDQGYGLGWVVIDYGDNRWIGHGG